MQEVHAFFLKAQQLHIDTGLIPSECAANLLRGLAAAFF
jgi:hypothetical protein